MTAQVVCISRTLGAGGEQIGMKVAERLGYRYVDDEIIIRAGERAQIDPSQIAKVEHRQSILDRLLGALATRPMVEHYLPEHDERPHAASSLPLPQEDLRHLIREAILEIAARGNAVILAHAASFALPQEPSILRVLVTASTKVRIRRVWLTGKLLNEGDAASAVSDSDAERAAYLRRFYDVRQELPTHYDLLINTDTLPTEAAAAAIAHAALAGSD
jgi:cytidylate kinase